MARLKGGQQLVAMSKFSRPLPRRADIIPGSGPDSMGLRPGEYYHADDSVVDILGESEDVFRAGYTDPRAAGRVGAATPTHWATGTPPVTNPFFRAIDAASGTPEQQEKEARIDDINAQIDSLIVKAGYDPETLEKVEKEPAPEDEFRGPENEFRGPEKEYLPKPKEKKPESNELIDVLKEMNKVIKAYKGGDSGPPQDKVGSSGMPDWAESGTGIVGRGATPPAAQTPPPPPMDQVGKEWREEWATAPDATAPTVAAPVVREGQQYMLSEEEIRNIGSMTLESVPTDRLILPPSFPTREDAAAEFDRLAEAGEPYPTVIFIRDEQEYVNIKDHPEMGQYTYGEIDIQLYNARVLLQLQDAQHKQRTKQVNQQLEQ